MFTVLEEEEADEVEEGPEEGAFIHGLFLDSAKWDREEKVLCDQAIGELYSRMPVIWFRPQANVERNAEDYSCPCYKTSERAGVLSTTG